MKFKAINHSLSQSYLIIQVKVVKLPVGAEMLSMLIQSKIDISPVALNYYRMPMMVVQKTAAGHRRMAQDGAVLITACGLLDRGDHHQYQTHDVFSFTVKHEDTYGWKQLLPHAFISRSGYVI